MTIVAMLLLIPASGALCQEAPYKPTIPAGQVVQSIPLMGRLLKPGERGVIGNEPASAGATSAEALTSLLGSRLANDQVGVKELVASGRAFALEPGTPFLVIVAHVAPPRGPRTTSLQGFARGLQAAASSGPRPLETLEIRILEGPLKDKALWVPTTVAGRLIPDPAIEQAEKLAAEDAENASRAAARAASKAAKETGDNAVIARSKAARPASLLAIGKNFEKDGKNALALENYRKVVADFGGTAQAKDAAARIKALTGK